jgi:DNA-nicking Smr family endonuclease
VNDKADWKAVKRGLAQAREAAERAREQERLDALARSTAAPPDDELFRRQVGDAKPLRAVPRVMHTRPPADPTPRQRQADEAAALAASISDELDVESLLDTDEALSFAREGLGADVPRRLRRGQWAMQAQIDLHGMTRDEAREALATFVHTSVQRGLRCVRVVHGKGIGSPGRVPVLKGKVRAWLVQNTHVMAFVQAPPTQGGHGAVLVLLNS